MKPKTPYQEIRQALRSVRGTGSVRRMKKADHPGYDYMIEVLLPRESADWEPEFVEQVRRLPILSEQVSNLLTYWGQDVRSWQIIVDPDAHTPRETA